MRRIVGVLDEGGEEAAVLRERLADDGVVASLLLIHDLYPVPLDDRVAEALDSVRPYMESHGGDVELLGIEDGVARLRLQGSCKTCPASSATLELADQAGAGRGGAGPRGPGGRGRDGGGAGRAGERHRAAGAAGRARRSAGRGSRRGTTWTVAERRSRRAGSAATEIGGVPLVVARVDGAPARLP